MGSWPWSCSLKGLAWSLQCLLRAWSQPSALTKTQPSGEMGHRREGSGGCSFRTAPALGSENTPFLFLSFPE